MVKLDFKALRGAMGAEPWCMVICNAVRRRDGTNHFEIELQTQSSER